MKYKIQCNPSYSVVEVTLDEDETIVAESGAMTWMSDNIKTETTMRGGLLASLKRKLLTGESFFQNKYTSTDGNAVIGFAPGAPGDIMPYELDDSELFLEKNAYLCSEEGVECDSKFQGLKGLFNEGMFALRCTGTGLMFFNAYGDIQEIDVDGEYMVDNGYAVAWEPSLEWKLTKARKISSFLFSDQILLRFMGEGKLWVQSRSPRAFARWAHPFRPQKKGGGGALGTVLDIAGS